MHLLHWAGIVLKQFLFLSFTYFHIVFESDSEQQTYYREGRKREEFLFQEYLYLIFKTSYAIRN